MINIYFSWKFYLSYIIPFVIVLLFIPFLIKLATKWGLVDYPGGRKQHGQPIAVVGGIAMFISFILSLCLIDIHLSQFKTMLLGVTVMFIVGVLDDMHEVSPIKRLFMQILCGAVMVFLGGTHIQYLGHFLVGSSHIELGFIGYPLTVFFVVAFINAFNMIDGADGLAAMICLSQIFWLLVLSIIQGESGYISLLLLVAGVLSGFLFYNFPSKNRSAKIFMGDGGSMWLGYVVVWVGVSLSQQHQNFFIGPNVFLWIMIVPLFDMCSVVISRISNGKSPFYPDRQHCHHLLLSFGLSKQSVVTLLTSLSLISGAIGLVVGFLGEPGWLSYFMLLVLFSSFHLVMVYLRRKVVLNI